MHGLLRGDGTELPVQGGHRARDLCRPAYGWFPTRKYTDMNVAVQSAHMACSELAAGKSEVAVELDVVGQNGNLSRADASWVIAGAKQAYCP